MKQRVFIPEIPTHNYQKGFNGNLLFYCLLDRLVYFTIFCTEASRRKITVLSLDLMFTHTHSFLKLASKEILSRFNQAVEMKYAQEFNRESGHIGHVFMRTYGWAQKKNNAKVRSCLAYIANNPVEKKLCRHASESRWNFWAYASSINPYSKPLVIRKASIAMRKAVKMVKDAQKRGQYLNYTFLRRVFAGLGKDERDQLTDFIIHTYLIVDFEAAGAYFGSVEKAIQAFDVTTGAEYDIKEEYEPEPDTAYVELIRLFEKDHKDLISKPFLSIPEGEKRMLLKQLIRKTSASYRQVSRFLHLPPSKAVKAPDASFAPPWSGWSASGDAPF